MGYYLNPGGLPNTGKADWLIANFNATEVPEPPRWEDIPEGKALVVVVKNLFFDAAGYVHSKEEWELFCSPKDPRFRRYLLMDLAETRFLSGYTHKVRNEP